MAGPTNSVNVKERMLWNELVRGDEAALGELMRLYYKPMINYGYKFIKDEEFIKDCMQDLFIELWNRRTHVSEPDSIKAYLFASLRRKIFRNGNKLRIFDQPLSDSNTENELSIEFSPEWWLIEEESLAQKTRETAELLNALPKRQREVLYLRYHQEMSREEISQLLSITPQTVSNLLQIAFNKLRQHGKTTLISLFLFTITF